MKSFYSVEILLSSFEMHTSEFFVRNAYIIITIDFFLLHYRNTFKLYRGSFFWILEEISILEFSV